MKSTSFYYPLACLCINIKLIQIEYSGLQCYYFLSYNPKASFLKNLVCMVLSIHHLQSTSTFQRFLFPTMLLNEGNSCSEASRLFRIVNESLESVEVTHFLLTNLRSKNYTSFNPLN